jgi:hypothetical protein
MENPFTKSAKVLTNDWFPSTPARRQRTSVPHGRLVAAFTALLRPNLETAKEKSEETVRATPPTILTLPPRNNDEWHDSQDTRAQLCFSLVPSFVAVVFSTDRGLYLRG